jgi:hypothetical protein
VERGELSNEIQPRALMVFEGLVAYPSTDNAISNLKLRVAKSTRRWVTVLDHWEFDEISVRQMWDMAWRRGLRFDIVTFLYEPEFAVALYHHLSDTMGFPVSNVLHFPDAQELARNLVFMPDVRIVYDGDPSRVGAYGSKGKLITDPTRDFFA